MGILSNMSLSEFVYNKIVIIPAILLAFAFHEFAHAKVADMLGDKTPRFQGRLTLNPASHIDPLGFFLILIVGFGWAKPVETNPRVYKNYYKDDLKVSIAGPVANLILSFLGALFYVLFIVFQSKIGFIPISIYKVLADIIYGICSINAMLFVFNLLPIPGLDGFWVLRDLAPKFFYNISDSMYRYQMMILIFIAFVGSRFLYIPVTYIANLNLNIVTAIINLFY